MTLEQKVKRMRQLNNLKESLQAQIRDLDREIARLAATLCPAGECLLVNEDSAPETTP